MEYEPNTNRTPLTLGLIEALGAKIGETIPYYTDADGNSVRVPVKYAYDEVSYTEYETPSVVIFNPNISKIRQLLTHEKVYRDLDYDKLTAKEFDEPIPVRVRFKLHFATRNPDNDLRLLEYMSKFYTTISYLDCPLVKDKNRYDRYQVVWFEPIEFESTDVSKIREIVGEVHAWLEVLSYKEVRLLAPGDAVELVHEDFSTSPANLRTKTSGEIYKATTEIPVSKPLKGWPVSGSAKIDNETFTYSSRKLYKFLGVSGIKMFHNFDTEIVYVES